MKRFLHSGRYGDLVYSFWTIKALGGGLLLFNITKGSLCTEKDFEFCKPLLEILPYIFGIETIKFRKEFECDDGQKLFCRQDVENPDLLILDNAWHWRCHKETYHWIHRYAFTFGIKVEASEQIIEVPIRDEPRKIVAHFTDRYRSGIPIPETFLKREDVFVINDGTYKNMLDMAIDIASSKFFIGNQSIGAALAQALQHPRLIERPANPFWHDAYPIGKHAFSFDNDFHLKLELVEQASKEFWEEEQYV